MILEKADKKEIPTLTADKVTKEDLEGLLPDVEAQETKLRDLVSEQMADLKQSLNDNLRIWDRKLVSIRKEMDIDMINKQLAGKANAD